MTDVIMPQMGESIAEGTVTKWLKQLGDKVERDEPLFEISTDKVDAEIPAPAAGVLKEIRVQPGATVPINTVVGVIAAEDESVASPAQAPAGEAAPAPAAAAAAASPVTPPAVTTPPVDTPPLATPLAADRPVATPPDTDPQATIRLAPVPAPPAESAPAPQTAFPAAAPSSEAPAAEPAGGTRSEMTVDELRQTRSSPVVRKIAAEHGVDISLIPGSGISGRVTKQDILSHLEGRAAQAEPTGAQPLGALPSAAAQVMPAPVEARVAPRVPAYQPGERVEVVPMSPIRRKTAEHMVASKRIAAHVTTVFEIELTRVDQLRKAHGPAYLERSGIKLTYLPFIIKATVDALKAFPILNSSVEGDTIVYKKDINVGIAVALDWGLIVPVIRNADERNLLGLARAVSDLAERARAKKLKVDEVQGGTFTITNPGAFGSLFGTPIINQPQVAILGVGTIEKRPVVRDDAIAIRTMSCFALSFDHRIVDGADADRFMAHIKKNLEAFDETAV